MKDAASFDVVNMLMLMAGVAGAIGGIGVASWALMAKKQRLKAERTLTPILERSCSARIDHVMFIGLRGARLALYPEFMVLRGPAVALQLQYGEIDEIRVNATGNRRTVTIRTCVEGFGRHIVLICGADTTEVAETLHRQRSFLMSESQRERIDS